MKATFIPKATADSAFLGELLAQLDTVPFSAGGAQPAPKRGKGRESASTAFNSLRRVGIDRILQTSAVLTESWLYGSWLFGHRCYICLEPFLSGEEVQADHVIPPSHGGSINGGNMLPAHRDCNDRKGDAHPDSYFRDQPEVLERLAHFREKFGLIVDASVAVKVEEVLKRLREELESFIVHEINQRELATDDFVADTQEVRRQPLVPQARSLMKAVELYLAQGDFAQSARLKVNSYSRKILQAWYSETPEEDLFSQDLETTKAFIYRVFLTLSDHPDAFNRTHRAFRVLGEVFDGASLNKLYSEGLPVNLAKLRETHRPTAGGWLPIESLTDTTVA